MDLQTLMQTIPSRYMGYVTAAVTICAALATVLPAPQAAPATMAAKVYAAVYNAVQFLAFNFGKATNKGTP